MDTLPLVAPEQVGLSAQRLDRVRKWMNGWVDSGRLAGMVTAVMRRGELAFAETYGKADIERNKPMRPDTIFRIYSMTKPLTSTAIMMLYEEGRFQLDDPISKFIPGFRNPRVYAGGSRGKIDSVPAEREITFRDLLTHTSGLTYGFMESNPVDALYRAKDRRRLDCALLRAARRGRQRSQADDPRPCRCDGQDRKAAGDRPARRDHRGLRCADGGARRSRCRIAAGAGAEPAEAND